MLSKLDVRLRTPTVSDAGSTVSNREWQSKTPSNPAELLSQSTLIKTRIQRHLDSLPTSIVDSLERLTKGAEIMGNSLVLMRDEMKTLRAANEAAKRRKSHKRKRVQKEGGLTVEEGARLTALKAFGARSDG